MQFVLPSPPFDANFTIHHQHNLYFIGSCFSESIGEYFKDRKFVTSINPHGVIYNPISIANSIHEIISGEIKEKSFYEKDELVQSFNHHSSISAKSTQDLGKLIVEKNTISRNSLKNANILFITLGTAWVYWHKELEKVVANNLKAPALLFNRKLLSIKEITSALQLLIENLENFNPKLKIVFTVSPVRHAKQGLVENNRSKSRLLESIHTLKEQYKVVKYFPSYELVIDVLRDYRFYKKDLLHPNEQATDFIWEYLIGNCIREEDKILIQKLNKLKAAFEHKLLQPKSDKSKSFIKAQLQSIQEIENDYCYIDLKKEKDYFENL